MRLQTPFMRVVVACGLGLAVTSGLYVTLQGKDMLQAPAEASVKVSVITVKAPVPALTKLTPEHLTTRQVPADLAPASAITDMSQVTGRFVRQNLYADELILDAKLFPAGQEYPTVLPLPVGKRAVTVAVNEVVGVAGFVQVGSIVDVIATMDREEGAVSRIILQEIQVLAAAQSKQKEEDAEAKVVSSVTLAVSPEEAEQLTLATEKGVIRLAMRSPLEDGEVATHGETAVSLINGRPAAPVKVASAKAPARGPVRSAPRVASKPITAPAPTRSLHEIMVIRGSNLTYVTR